MTDEDIKRLRELRDAATPGRFGKPAFDFLDAAHAAIPALLDEVERLRTFEDLWMTAHKVTGCHKHGPVAALTERAERAESERDEARSVAGACEESMRALACYLGVGGYNTDTFDPEVFHQKIRDGIDMATVPIRQFIERASKAEARAERAEKVVEAVVDIAETLLSASLTVVRTDGQFPEQINNLRTVCVETRKALSACACDATTAPAEPTPTGKQVDTWVEPFIAEVRKQRAEGRSLDAEAVRSILYGAAEPTDAPQAGLVDGGVSEGGSGETKTFARPLTWNVMGDGR